MKKTSVVLMIEYMERNYKENGHDVTLGPHSANFANSIREYDLFVRNHKTNIKIRQPTLIGRH